MCELLAELVATPTENPPGREYDACVERLERAVRALALPVEHIAIAGPDGVKRAAVRTHIGGDGPVLYFHGHYDVVPAQSPEQFVPTIEGDTLFGRGSSDMKSGLVAMLYAAAMLRDLDVTLRGRVELLFVPDEETGGARGTAVLAESGVIGRDGIGMLLPEPTSGVVWHANRGALSLEVTVRGRAAHVGLMHQGVNAFERAIDVVRRLEPVQRDVRARGSIMLVGGRVEAGSNFNVVPEACRFTIDRRTNPDEDFDAERERLMAVFDAARADGIDLDVRVFQEGRPAQTAPDGALGAALASATTEVEGNAPAFEMCPGLLETRFYAARGVPALAYGPGILAVSHGPREFVRISRMIACAQVYALTAARLLA
jgi:acetylornithine deacetylase/succinyl-diaminopimelate desuccinylase family protein